MVRVMEYINYDAKTNGAILESGRPRGVKQKQNGVRRKWCYSCHFNSPTNIQFLYVSSDVSS